MLTAPWWQPCLRMITRDRETDLFVELEATIWLENCCLTQNKFILNILLEESNLVVSLDNQPGILSFHDKFRLQNQFQWFLEWWNATRINCLPLAEHGTFRLPFAALSPLASIVGLLKIFNFSQKYFYYNNFYINMSLKQILTGKTRVTTQFASTLQFIY